MWVMDVSIFFAYGMSLQDIYTGFTDLMGE